MKYLTFMMRFRKESIDSICIDVPYEDDASGDEINIAVGKKVLDTLAEGVYDPEEQEFIKTLGVDDIKDLFQLHKVVPGNDRTY